LGPLFRPAAPFQVVDRVRVVLCPASRVRGAFLTRAQPDALPHAAITRRGLHLPPNSSPSLQPAVASCIRQRIEPMVHPPPHARQTRRSQYAATTRRRLYLPPNLWPLLQRDVASYTRQHVVHDLLLLPPEKALRGGDVFPKQRPTDVRWSSRGTWEAA
jgi:hypothetical protein